ncbi:hypothetical protein T12_6564 [Trichinella patagoniensis]|uniref:Uncharacterized protein n=1 Tax=Trichinella patagoniensis TaxID=990121 RepID=A0A0V1A833_9BILA|nr:hypothetical protein T12_6564 [Trichinella patagoniensis]
MHTVEKRLAERGFDPRTSGLWAQHASSAPLCCCITIRQNNGNEMSKKQDCQFAIKCCKSENVERHANF